MGYLLYNFLLHVSQSLTYRIELITILGALACLFASPQGWHDTMQRRNFMKTVGGIGTASALGVGGMVFASNPVSATSDLSGTVSLSSDTGEIDFVAIYGDGYVQWKGLDTRATQAKIQSRVTVSNQGNEVVSKRVNDTGTFSLDDDSWGGDDEELSGSGTRGFIKTAVGLHSNGNHDPSTDWAIIQASDYTDPYGLPADPVDAAYLSVGTDGGSKTYKITVTTTYRLYDASGNQLQTASASSSFNVEVSNIAAQTSTGSVGGSDGSVGGTSNNGTLYN